MTEERKNILEALENIGCTNPYNDDSMNWVYKNYSFRVPENITLTEIFKILMKVSETVKIWEIKSVLQL